MNHTKEFCLQEIQYWIRYLELMDSHVTHFGFKYCDNQWLRALSYIKVYQFRLKQLEALS